MPTILAIDDKQDNLVALSALLKLTFPDCTVHTALSGQEGLNRVQGDVPDAILLDIIMPVMDGYEVCRRLRANPHTMHIPIILLTAVRTDAQSRIKGLEAGADAFLAKPIDEGELVAQINVMLRIRRAEHLLLQERNLLEELVQVRTLDLEKTNRDLQTQLNLRKQTEERLKTQQYYLEKAQEMGRIGTWELDIRKNILTWTDENYRIFGVPTGADLTYERFLGCIHPDDRAYVQERWSAALNHEPYDIEHRLIIDGRIKWVREKAEVAFNEQCVAVKGIGFAQDITDRKLAEESLQREVDKNETLLDNIPCVAMIIKKGSHEIVASNKAAEEIGAVPGTTCYGTCAQRDGACPFCLASDMWDDNQPRRLETEYRGKFYEGIWVPLTDELYVHYIFDITDRMQAQRDLLESYQLNQQIIDGVKEGVIVYDLELRYKEWNPFMERISGRRASEVLGRSPMEVFPFLKEAGVVRRLEQALAGETLPPLEFPFDLRPTGLSGWASDVSSPLYDTDGNIVGVIGVVRDITQEKKHREHLAEYQGRLKALATQLTLAEERQNRQLAEALHDGVGQSLAFAKMKIQMLGEKSGAGQLGDELGQLCQVVSDIIEDVRNLTYGLNSPVLRSLGFERAIASWLHDQVQGQHEIQTEFADDGSYKGLSADEEAILFRSIRELVTNAIKHAHATLIQVAIYRCKDDVVATVTDNGCGFNAHEVLSDSRQRGFGLFSIQERLDQMNGTLTLESTPGQGCRVMMKLSVIDTSCCGS